MEVAAPCIMVVRDNCVVLNVSVLHMKETGMETRHGSSGNSQTFYRTQAFVMNEALVLFRQCTLCALGFTIGRLGYAE